MIYNQERGVATLMFVLIGVLIITVLSGAGYGTYKYRQTTKENSVLKAQFEAQKNQLLEQSQVQNINTEVADIDDSTTTIETPVTENLKPVEKFVHTSETPTISAVDRQAEIDLAVTKALAEQAREQENLVPIQETKTEEAESVPEEQTELDSPIKVIQVGQTAYPDGYGGVYGSYGITINVTARGGDILIPMTTTDSLGTGNIGFSYSILGGSFKGAQDSEVSSCTLRVGNNCKVRDGQSKDMKVTVWLTPDQDSDGNYAVQFDRVLYFFNGEQRTFEINQSSEKIHLYF